MFKNPVWTRFVVFTATIFLLAVAYFSPRHASAAFWTIITAMFVMHVVFFVALIRYVRELTGLDYTLYGPLEALIFAYVIPRATRTIRGWRLGRSPRTD
jgi:hypothetical protein